MWTKEFWLDTAERTVYTIAEILIGFITVDQTISPIDWKNALITSGIAGLATLLKCITVKAINDGKAD